MLIMTKIDRYSGFCYIIHDEFRLYLENKAFSTPWISNINILYYTRSPGLSVDKVIYWFPASQKDVIEGICRIAPITRVGLNFMAPVIEIHIHSIPLSKDECLHYSISNIFKYISIPKIFKPILLCPSICLLNKG